MIVTTSSFTFETTGRSLWNPGPALELAFSTLEYDFFDWLVFDPARQTFDISVDAGLIGFSADFYYDVKFGLELFANLGQSGAFDASFDMSVDVEHETVVQIFPQVGDPAGNELVTFNFSDFSVDRASIESRGFSAAKNAGLNLLVSVAAGIENATLETFIKDVDLGNLVLIPQIDMVIPLIEVTLDKAEAELTSDSLPISLTARLPTGADTSAVAFDTGSVSASGISTTKFVELAADLDQLILDLLGKIPGAAFVTKPLQETVFAKHEFDLHDYVEAVPESALVFELTVVDIYASIGAAIAETVTIDLTNGSGNEADAEVYVQLKSDNGTPDDTSDDFFVPQSQFEGGRRRLGDNPSVTFDPILEFAGGSWGDTGIATITAEYSIENAQFTHDLGINVNGAITIDVLKGKLAGDIVPEDLEVQFGPLFSIDLPPGGIDFGTFNLFSNSFGLQNQSIFGVPLDAFETQTEQFEVFYAANVPAGLDLNAPTAQIELLDYLDAIAENIEASKSTFAFLLADPNNPGEIIEPDRLSPAQPNRTGVANGARILWDGSTTSVVDVTGENNAVLIQFPENPGQDEQMSFSVVGAEGVSPDLELARALGDGVEVEVTFDGRSLTTSSPLNIVGGNNSDRLVSTGGVDQGQFFDGGAGRDRFFANFSGDDTPVVFDASEVTGFDDDGEDLALDLANGVTLRNLEVFYIVFGGGDDFIRGGSGDDGFDGGGGDDVFILTEDRNPDTVYGGDGDDVFVVELSDVLFDGTRDLIFGGEGEDQMFITGAEFGIELGLKEDVEDDNSGSGSPVRVRNFDSLTVVIDALREVDAYFSGDESLFIRLENGPQLGMGAQRREVTGASVEFSSDIEHISVQGSDVQNDIVMYAGGFRYYGGGFGVPGESDRDTFVADFYQWAERGQQQLSAGVDVTNILPGVTIVAEDIFVPGNAAQNVQNFALSGFERLVVSGTSGSDQFIGGHWNDYLNGSTGNDILDGGEDFHGDLLVGGRGDDAFLWSHDGFDYVFGDDLPSNLGGGQRNSQIDNDWLFISHGDEAERGLRIGMMRAGDLENVLAEDSASGTISAETYDAFEANFIAAGLDLADVVTPLTGADASFSQLGFLLSDYTNLSSSYRLYSFGDEQDALRVADIEHTNITGSDEFGDLLIYQNGVSYIGGDGAAVDTFVADFTSDIIGLTVVVDDRSINQGTIAEEDIVLRRGVQTGTEIGNGVFVGGIERLYILGGSGADLFAGGDQDDYLDSGAGADIVMDGAGDDAVHLGDGTDLFVWSGLGDDQVEGGAGTDGVVIGAVTEGANFAVVNGGGLAVVTQSSTAEALGAIDALANGGELRFSIGENHLVVDGIEQVDFSGADEFNDAMLYVSGSTVFGGEAASGFDLDLVVADLSDSDVGIEFDGSLQQDASGESILQDLGDGGRVGEFERIVFRLGSGDDDIVGGVFDDVIFGGFGNDRLDGGFTLSSPDADLVDGGEGDDTLSFGGGEDTYSGGIGEDVLEASFLSQSSVSLDAFADGAVENAPDVSLTAEMVTDYLTASDVSGLEAGISSFFAQGFDHGTVFVNRAGSEFLEFESFENVEFEGAAQTDILVSGLEQGILSGRGGDDLLLSLQGDDILYGGDGLDIYAFGTNFGSDLVVGETNGGGVLWFAGETVESLTIDKFSNDAQDLMINTASGELRVVNYFIDGGAGFNFAFVTSNGVASLDLSTLGGSGIERTSGQVQIGTPDSDDLGDAEAANFDFDDTLIAFAGDDLLRGSGGGDFIDGSAGVDLIAYVDSDEYVVVDLETKRGTNGDADRDVLLSIENVAGSTFADHLRGDRDNNALFGVDGDDVIDGRAGDDTLAGDDGNDVVSGASGADELFGNDGLDSLSGGDGADTLFGGDGVDLLEGGDGNDTLNGGDGGDRLFGGSGDDRLLIAGGLSNSFIDVEGRFRPDAAELELVGYDILDGGAGIDFVDFGQFGGAVFVSGNFAFMSSVDPLVPDPAAGPIRAIANLISIEGIVGSQFDDAIKGDAVGNTFFGGFGADTLVGGGGADSIDGGGGQDTVDYSLESGMTGISLTVGEAGIAVIDTFGDTDVLTEIEMVRGSRFDDSFVGGAGNEVFDGHLGADNFDGQNGIDTVTYASSAAAVSVDVRAGTAIGGFAEGDSFTSIEIFVGSNLNDSLLGADEQDQLEGGAGDDLLAGRIGDDVIIGGDGDDALWGNGSGIDGSFLVDADGADTIVGGAGDDFIAGAGGRDQLFGGAGNDRFLVAVNAGVVGASVDPGDDIDGGDGFDWLLLETYFPISGSGLGWEVSLEAETYLNREAPNDYYSLIDVENISGSQGSDLLTGTDSTNRIFAEAGLDTVLGGDGSDTLAGGDDSDLVEGGGGNDILFGDDNVDVDALLATLGVG